jgi:hypothetical protein
VNSTFHPTRRTSGPAQRWRIGGAAVVVGAAVALAVAMQPRAAAPVAPSRSAAPPVETTAPIEGYAVEGTQGYEWRTRSAMDGYALVEGPFGYEVVGHGPAAPQAVLGDMVALRVDGVRRMVSAEDGYYDEGPSGYEWRLRPGR